MKGHNYCVLVGGPIDIFTTERKKSTCSKQEADLSQKQFTSSKLTKQLKKINCADSTFFYQEV